MQSVQSHCLCSLNLFLENVAKLAMIFNRFKLMVFTRFHNGLKCIKIFKFQSLWEAYSSKAIPLFFSFSVECVSCWVGRIDKKNHHWKSWNRRRGTRASLLWSLETTRHEPKINMSEMLVDQPPKLLCDILKWFINVVTFCFEQQNIGSVIKKKKKKKTLRR